MIQIEDGSVTENHPAWAILLPRLSFLDQMRLSLTCKKFRDSNQSNADFYLRRFRKRLKKNKNL